MSLGRGGSGELLQVIERGLRLVHRLIRAVVAAEHDGVMIGAALQCRQRMVEIGDEGAVAPGVERIAVAGHIADQTVEIGLQLGRQRRQRQIGSLGDVEHQLGEPARRGDRPDAPAGGRPRALAGRKQFGERSEILHLDSPMGAQHVRERSRVAGIARRVAGDSAAGAFAAPDLQHDYRLVESGGAVERSGEVLRLAHGFDKAADHASVRILDQVFEKIGRVQYRLVAGRHDVAETEAAEIGQQADAEPAALRDDPDIARQPLGFPDLLQVGRVALDRVQDAHAVRTAQRDPGLTANGDNSLLQRASFRAALGEATVINHRTANAALGCRNEAIQHMPMAETEHRRVGDFGCLGDARDSSPAPAPSGNSG